MDNLLIELKEIVGKIKTAKNEAEKQLFQLEAVNKLAEIFKPEATEAVKSIEGKFATTKGHYGDYLHLITSFNGLYRLGFIKALKEAGADQEGISGAISLLTL